MGGDKSTVFSKGGRGGRGVSNYHDRIVGGLKIGVHIIFDPPLPFTLNIYERPYMETNIVYGVVFGTASVVNQTLCHHFHHNI